MDDVSKLLAEDVTAPVAPREENLERVAREIAELRRLEEQIARSEEELDKLKKQRDHLSSEIVPELFDELGLQKLKLVTGETVEITKMYAASISEANWPAARAWLEKTGNLDIVKNEVVVKFGRGEEEQKRLLETALSRDGLTYVSKISVHPQTLRAFVREQVERGSDIPWQVFGIFEIRRTTIKQ